MARAVSLGSSAATLLLCALTFAHASIIVTNPGGPGGYTNAGGSPGAPFGWVGTAGDVSTATGNKVTSVPLVAWTARGGLPVSFVLTHNSEEPYSNFNGQKWTYSYLDFLVDNGTKGVTAYWDDGSIYTFTLSGSAYSPPAGIFSTLVKNGTGNFTLTTKDQIAYQFTHVVSNEPGYAFLTSIGDENNNAITVAYTSASSFAIASVTDPTGRAVNLAYDAYGRLSTVEDPLGRVWTLGYNANSYVNCDLTSITFPAINGTSPQMTFAYGAPSYAPDDITGMTDLRGKTSDYAYTSDYTSSVASETDPSNLTTSFSYNTATRQATITDPNGHTRVDTYDSNGRRTQVTDTYGFSDTYTYDAFNNVLTHTDRNANSNAGGGTWTYTYDSGNANASSRGNLLSSLDPRNSAAGLAATDYTYTAHNRLSYVIKPSGTNATLYYDGNDNLTSVAEGYLPKGLGRRNITTATTTIGYPSPNYGLPSSKTDTNGHETLYAFGLAGNLYQVSTPLGKTTTWYYDTLGFPTKRVDAMNRTTIYTPDAWERLTTITYPDNSQHTFSYDNNGNLTAFADAAASITRAYDSDNRLLTETWGGYQLTNTYDASGQLGLRASSAHGTQTIHYTYTPRNELYTVADSAGTSTYGYTSGGHPYYGYDADGNEDQQTLANGARVGKLFDADSSLTEVNNVLPNGTAASQFLYTAYDGDGRKSSGTDATGSSMAWSYDNQSHLASDTRTNGCAPYNDGFVLDGVGNRSQLTNVYGTFAFLYNGDDQLTNYANGAYTFAYNANGDMSQSTLNGNVSNLTYDYDDNLTGISSAAGTVSYLYDALGRRVYREDASGIVHSFVYDGASVVGEFNNTTDVWDTQYTYGYDLLDKQGTGGTEFPLYNGQGDVFQTLTPSGGYVLSDHILDDFGQGFAGASGTDDLVYQWRASSGYRSDGDGLWNGSYNEPIEKVGARYYIPSMGVFITRDKDLAEQPYEYCNADPVNNVDPSGYDDSSTTTIKKNPDGSTTQTTTTPNSNGTTTTVTIVTPANPNQPTQTTISITTTVPGGSVTTGLGSGAGTPGSVTVTGTASPGVTVSVGGKANLTGPISSSVTFGIGYTFGFGKITFGLIGTSGQAGLGYTLGVNDKF